MELIKFSNQFVFILLACLCLLAIIDLYHQYHLKYHDFLFFHYSSGMQKDHNLWKIGYKNENLQIKLQYQIKKIQQFDEILEKELGNLRSESFTHSRIIQSNNHFIERKKFKTILNQFEMNLNRTYELWCEDINQQVRIGSSDFRTDERDSCLLYAGDEKNSIQGPETIFELIDLGDQAFGLKSISNGQFVQVIPPGSGDTFDPWKISLGSNIPGANEKFRLSPDGYLYSGLMGKLSIKLALELFLI